MIEDRLDPELSTEGPGRKLNGRVAFVTGGTRGIGAAISLSLASQGASVAAGYSSNATRAEEFLLRLKDAAGGTATMSLHRGDVAIADDCRRTIAELIDKQG